MQSFSLISLPGFSEPFSSISHLVAAFAFCIFSLKLFWRGRGNVARLLSLVIYSACAVYLFSMSGIYHLLEPGGEARAIFQRLDHSGIWMMIAGSFTPIHVILFRKTLRWGVLLFVWIVAIFGLVFEVVFFNEFPEWLSLFLYLLLGWFGLVTFLYYKKIHSKRIINYLIYGGISYSFGAVVEYLKLVNLIPGVIGSHEIFHVFVLLGASFHAYFIYLIADIYIKEKLTLLVKDCDRQGFLIIGQGEKITFSANTVEEARQKLREIINQNYSLAHIPVSVQLNFQREFALAENMTTNKDNSDATAQSFNDSTPERAPSNKLIV